MVVITFIYKTVFLSTAPNMLTLKVLVTTIDALGHF